MKPNVACLLAALLLAGCSGLPREEQEIPIVVATPTVTQRETLEIKRGPVDSRVSLNVSFGADRQSPLYFRTGGRIKQMAARVGVQVQAGELLAELENSSLAYDISGAELDVKRKELSLSTGLAKKGFTDAPSSADLTRLEFDLEQSRAALAYKHEQLAATRILAPFSGRIISVSYGDGDNAEAYKEAVVIAGDGPLVARTTIDDVTAALIQVGHPVEIFPADGDPTPVKGRVTIVPLAGTLRTDKVLVAAPEAASTRLQVGRNGRIDVITQRKEDVLLVPLSAIRSFGGRQFVTIVKGETRQEVAITTGLQGTTHAEVIEGLQAGDRVVSR